MDQNLDYMKSQYHSRTMEFLDVNLTNFVYPTISRPTRITKNTATLIDNIYISEFLANNYKTYILEEEISDHLPCLLLLNKPFKKTRDPLCFKTRYLNEAKYDSINSEIEKVNWTELNPNNNFDTFHIKLWSIIDQIAPE